ncbi:phosphoribosylanthranilate isomerase [Alienimonas chondri]|uniref:N-(5'-phosphoribosyl)anthranilate isomerase n=1 Tax=Alienimonas chondri TaxID=2681879 RepID=A0ABX1VEK7_9PLAN|nr:phosphoribosylanthranilate isomerase [Alienimonas chondri]NNJ26325.1 N-(5'-phosphoribosyl)anthranilate isomerase [Alienimonas chondri]
MFVKICGFTDPANLASVCQANVRPDAVGLNFWPGSKRYVTPETGAEFANLAADAGIRRWGLFVDPSNEDLERAAAVDLSAVQLHGDEPPDAFAQVAERRPVHEYVRAWRVERSLDPLLDHLAAQPDACRADYLLLDASVPGAYGGTGAKLDWHAVRDEMDRVGDRLPPVVLAGGLTPDNVVEAVRIVRPWGVDVAGGVERAPGIKDPAKVAAFCENARGAL